MRVDGFAIRLRQRGYLEAADLGVRLYQSSARSVLRCYLAVTTPVMVVALATCGIGPLLPVAVLWLAKPWLDRTILFALSRAALGQQTFLSDLWRDARSVLGGRLLLTWTIQRLSPWRSFTQPVYQLEGLGGSQLRQRVVRIRSRKLVAATAVTTMFCLAEAILTLAVLELVRWLAPNGHEPDFLRGWSSGSAGFTVICLAVAYFAAVLFVEPFYVAAGFGLYLNRRVELEAWDIEQELRRAFGS